MRIPIMVSRDFKQRIEEFVTSLLPEDLEPIDVRDDKVIHDSVWGTNIFRRWEIAIIDTPLIQRLRGISQTGIAFYTYPSARHSRFEHSLGVTIMASKFAAKLREKNPKIIDADADKGDLAEIRMAAILHDCGHALFSHASEDIYKWDKDISSLRQESMFADANAQEILSYHIIESTAFLAYFKNVQHMYKTNIDINVVKNLIIGRHLDPKRTYIAEIINGPFDADKLDYLARDGLFCGLQLPADVDRLFYTTDIHPFEDGRVRLVVGSPAPVEQILFSKMMLFSSLYHHQKVRAAECYFKCIIELLRDHNLELRGKGCNDSVDLLRLTDSDFLNAEPPPENAEIADMIKRLSRRQLPRRAVVISKDTVENFNEGYEYFVHRYQELPPRHLKNVRTAIQGNLPSDKRCSIYDIWLDLPTLPSLKDARRTYVRVNEGTDPIPATDLFPLEGWIRAYGIYRWRAHVFCPLGFQEQVYKATREVFAEAEPVPIKLTDKSWEFTKATPSP